MDRRKFVLTAAAAGLTAATSKMAFADAPNVLLKKRARPMVISDHSGIAYTNGGPQSAVEKAFEMIVSGSDVLDALIAGVNIPELDPTEAGIGYGGLPNERGVVQLDSCCMHGPRRQAGGVAALEGVRTPSLVAKAVMEYTDHHLLVGQGAQDFARSIGITIEDDLNTEHSRRLWLEWKRRVDPNHYLDPAERRRRGYEAGLQMVREGLIDENHFWGTINCNGINADGDLCGVTTTSGLAWKIPGRAGDSPILGAGLYVDNDVGAAGSTGRGEAVIQSAGSFAVVRAMADGLEPTAACFRVLKWIADHTKRRDLLNDKAEPNFQVVMYALRKDGAWGSAGLRKGGTFTVHDGTEVRKKECPSLF